MPPPSSTRRIGLFGGSFDPVHAAHVALARAALEALTLDELRWIPAGQAWQKTRTLTAPAQREAMIRLAIAGEPRFVLDRCDIERGGPSYTVDTVAALRAREPGARLFLIIGADQYAGLHSWHRWRDLLASVTLAVANRPGPVPAPAPEVREQARQTVPLPMLDISSTVIRAKVARGEPIDALVPPAVARYIGQHSLYREGTSH